MANKKKVVKNNKDEKIVKEEKVTIKDNNKKRYIIIGLLYIMCSIMWIVGGFIKIKNDVSAVALDFIAGALLLMLGVMYLLRARNEK